MNCHPVARWSLGVFLALALLPSIAVAQPQRDAPVSRWNGTQWVQVDGVGVRIAVAPDGSSWVVNAANQIYRRVGGQFQHVPGSATDIGVGGDGSVWIIGTDGGVQRLQGDRWVRMDGTGVAISVDRSGTPWVVNKEGRIYRMSGNRFVPVPGTATDIGAENSTWVVGDNGGIQEVTAGGLSSPQGTGVRVSGGLGGPWVVNAAGDIHKWENGSFRQMPGSASDIAANAQGDAWIIGSQGRAAQPRQRQRRR